MNNKRGQGLSLTTIIVAALALIVLVVLVMIFTGRIAIFQQGVSEQGQTELISLRVQYGDCHPTTTQENNFVTNLNAAADAAGEDTAKSDYREIISRCKAVDGQDSCASAGCSWK